MERLGSVKRRSLFKLSARSEIYYLRMAIIRPKERYYPLSVWIRGPEQWDIHCEQCVHTRMRSILGYLLTQGGICTLLVLLRGAVWGIS